MWFLAWLAFLIVSFVLWYIYKIGPRKLVVYGLVSLGAFWVGGKVFERQPEVVCRSDDDRPLRQDIELKGPKSQVSVTVPREVARYEIDRARVQGDLVIRFSDGFKDTWSSGESKSSWGRRIPQSLSGTGKAVLTLFPKVCATPSQWERIEAARKAKKLEVAPVKSGPPPARLEASVIPSPDPSPPKPAPSPAAPPPIRPEAHHEEARSSPPARTRYVEVPLKGDKRWVSVRSLVPKCTRWTFEATDRTELQLLDGSVDTILPGSDRKEYANTRPSRARGNGVLKLWLHEPIGDCTVAKTP